MVFSELRRSCSRTDSAHTSRCAPRLPPRNRLRSGGNSKIRSVAAHTSKRSSGQPRPRSNSARDAAETILHTFGMESAASLATQAKFLAIQSGLLRWFAENRRDLPWRHTRDPYAILVSEVMLQQTQVDRVIPYFRSFLERFPTVRDLAAAATADVITLWAGLGYNRRAVNLQRTARAVVDQHSGAFPSDPETLATLPGIGPYTAGAIACFAFEQDVAFLDTN